MAGWLSLGISLGTFACVAGIYLESRKIKQMMEHMADKAGTQSDKK